tara:strand:- start:14631 stop:14831 length:201 start_codon:yes stop_codon:yes gene_type:complete
MYNAGFKAYKNLQIPKQKKQPVQSTGLLSRSPSMPQQNTNDKLEPRERIAKYVMEIRKARQELKNG